MKFRVLGGNHVEDGKVFRKGEVVESKRQLDKMFVNKFQFLDGETTSKKKQPETETIKKEEGVLSNHEFEGVDTEFHALQVVKKGTYYYAFSEDGEQLNEKGLRKQRMRRFLEELYGQSSQ